ncbi:MAG: HEAT repeat domain-containing protein [Planctomycetes bacterium]|nr:HEAT repeat domain-containing protein [Planctomycetota bacterium]
MTTLILALAFLAANDDTAATAALDKFKTDYKSKEATVRASAVAELARTENDKVTARLAQLLVTDEKEVRIAAAKGLGGCTENKKKPVAVLCAAIGPNAKEVPVLAAILEALGKLKEPPAAAEVERHFKSKQIPEAKAAIEAAAAIGSRTSAQPLIETLRWLEEGAKDAPAYGGGGGGKTPSVGGNGTSDEAGKERERMLRSVVLKALETITKSSHSNAKEWEDWWRSEGGRFMSGK